MNYFYNNQPVSKSVFLQSDPPDDWENQLDEFGEFSWGYYRAIKIEA